MRVSSRLPATALALEAATVALAVRLNSSDPRFFIGHATALLDLAMRNRIAAFFRAKLVRLSFEAVTP